MQQGGTEARRKEGFDLILSSSKRSLRVSVSPCCISLFSSRRGTREDPSEAGASSGERSERLALLGRERSRGRGATRLRGLSRLPHVRELLRLLPGHVRGGGSRHRD